MFENPPTQELKARQKMLTTLEGKAASADKAARKAAEAAVAVVDATEDVVAAQGAVAAAEEALIKIHAELANGAGPS